MAPTATAGRRARPGRHALRPPGLTHAPTLAQQKSTTRCCRAVGAIRLPLGGTRSRAIETAGDRPHSMESRQAESSPARACNARRYEPMPNPAMVPLATAAMTEL